MKFVHIADVHFDSPFAGLNAKENLGSVRRLEQREVFRKVIDYIQKNEVEYLWIVGDLYEQEYVKKSTIEYINHLFEEIPNTKILIAPGNHDPYIKGSYYDIFNWSTNVHICQNKWEVIQESNVDIYMTAFTDFYQNETLLEQIEINHPDRINILLTHCDLNGFRDKNGYSYNPILESKLNDFKFDYVAMGHIHKTNFGPNKKMIYPGSPISFGFDEIGEHGMVVGEITKYGLDTKFIKLDDRIFVKYEFCVDNMASQEDLVEAIMNLKLETQNVYEIILVGNRQFDINAREVFKLIDSNNILKIKDCTQVGYDIEKIARENNLRGIFVREVMKKYKEGIYTEEQIKKAIEVGLEVM